MAHYLAGGEDQIGFSGEKIDDYSYTVAGPATTSSRWYVLYRQQLDRCRDALAIGRQRSQASSTRTSPGFLTCTSIRTPSCA